MYNTVTPMKRESNRRGGFQRAADSASAATEHGGEWAFEGAPRDGRQVFLRL